MPVIVMTGQGDVPLAVEAMKLGAHDFIEKPFEDETIIGAIRSALEKAVAGETADPALAEFKTRLSTLSPRERQVLDGLIAGDANKVMAIDLNISPRTIEIYRAKLMSKMQASSYRNWSALQYARVLPELIQINAAARPSCLATKSGLTQASH